MPSRPGEVVVDSIFDEAMEGQVDSGLSVPVTPPMTSANVPPTPRHAHDTRAHGPDDDDDHEAKRARVEAQTKQKISRMMEFNESMIRTVKIGTDEFSTLDDYSNELDMIEEPPDDDFWNDEDQVSFASVPDALWSDLPLWKVALDDVLLVGKETPTSFSCGTCRNASLMSRAARVIPHSPSFGTSIDSTNIRKYIRGTRFAE